MVDISIVKGLYRLYTLHVYYIYIRYIFDIYFTPRRPLFSRAIWGGFLPTLCRWRAGTRPGEEEWARAIKVNQSNDVITIHTHIYISTYVEDIHTYIHIYTYNNEFIQTCIHMFIHVYIYIHTYIYIYIFMSFSYIYTLVCVPASISVSDTWWAGVSRRFCSKPDEWGK